MSYSSVQWIAGAALGPMLFCLIEGMLLATLVAVAVRLLPGKSSETRFIIWFSALLATASLPVLLFLGWTKEGLSGVAKTESVTIPAGLATNIFLGWVVLASAGLVRVAVGLLGLRRLRRNSREAEPGLLGPELRTEMEDFRKKRQLKLLVSPGLHVPTAIGFFSPAIVLPQWLVEEGAAEDLKHVVLHELAHLRRRDDWTNLLQKVIKAVLFFHPAVWWLERKVSLDREMACDDAVLARTQSPRVYAELLARMAEKSFLRRQIELAQAVVGRLRQLSTRVARILDPRRPVSSGLWRPAAPGVVVLAIISGAGLSWVPELVKVGAPAGHEVVATNGRSTVEEHKSSAHVDAWQNKPDASPTAGATLYHAAKLPQTVSTSRKKPVTVTTAKAKTPQASPSVNAGYEAAKQGGFVVLVETQETFIATPSGWRMSVTETRWLIPARVARPQTFNKT